MAGKTAILSVKIVSDSKNGVAGLLKTAAAVSGLEKAAARGRKASVDFVRSVPRIAAVATGIGTLATSATASVGGILALGGSLATVSGAALALPAVLAAGGVAAVVLSSAMRDAGEVLADLGPAFSALQDNISANYWEKAAGPIRDLATSVLPILDTALSNTATIMGTGMATAANTLRDALAGSLGPIMSDINTGFHNANAAIEPFIRGMVTLTEVGATYLPAMGDGIARMGEAFNAWVQSANAAGDLNRWIEAGAAGLADLGSIAVSTVGVFGALARAAQEAGGAGLGAFADGLARVSDALNGPVWQGALTTIFEGAFQGISNLTPGVSALGDAFIALAPTLAEIMAVFGQIANVVVTGLAAALSHPAFMGGAEAALNGIMVGATALAPAFEALGPVVGAVLDLFGTLAAAILPVIGALFTALAPVVTALADALKPVVTALGEGLLAAVEALVPPLAGLVTDLLPIFSTALTGILDALLPLVVGILGLVGSLAEQLAPVLTTMITALLPVIVDLFTQLAPPILDLVEALVPLIVTLVEGLVPALTTLITDVIPPLIPVLVSVVEGVTAVVEAIAPFVTQLVDNLAPALVMIGTAIADTFNNLGPIVQAGLDIVVGIVQTVMGVLTGDWSLAWEGLVTIGQGVFDAIAGVVQMGMDAISNLVGGALDGIVSIWNTGWELTKNNLSSAWQSIRSTAVSALASLVSTVSSGVSNVVTFFGTLPGRAVSALAGMAASLYTVGQNIMTGLRNGVVSMAASIISSVTGTVRNAISGAKALLGINSPSRVFRDIGRFTGQGMVLGLKSQSAAVLRATENMLAVPDARVAEFGARPLRMDLQYQGRGHQPAQAPTVVHNYINVNGHVHDRLGTAEALDELLRERALVMGGGRR